MWELRAYLANLVEKASAVDEIGVATEGDQCDGYGGISGRSEDVSVTRQAIGASLLGGVLNAFSIVPRSSSTWETPVQSNDKPGSCAVCKCIIALSNYCRRKESLLGRSKEALRLIAAELLRFSRISSSTISATERDTSQ